jgi:hypothetical protein
MWRPEFRELFPGEGRCKKPRTEISMLPWEYREGRWRRTRQEKESRGPASSSVLQHQKPEGSVDAGLLGSWRTMGT